MKNLYGEVFREMREEKGYSIAETARNIVTPSFVSKFERGQSNISLDAFLKLLERINVNMAEYTFRINGYEKSEFGQLIDDCMHSYNIRDTNGLEKLHRYQLGLFEFTNIKAYKIKAIMVQSFLEDFSDFKVSEADRKYMYEYLFSLESWGYFEISVFGNAITIFSIEQLTMIAKTLLHKTGLLDVQPTVKDTMLKALLNIIGQLIDMKDRKNVEYLLKKLKSQNIKNDGIRLKVKFYEGILAIMRGNSTEGLDSCTKVLEAYDLIDETIARINSEKLLNRIVSEYMTEK